VHKLTENARFFAQKPHFLHIFAGGRDDFLAGRKWGFSGVWESRERPRPIPVFEPCSNPKIDLMQLRIIRIGYKKNIYIFLYPPFTAKREKL
jgi:hypothetical protein